LPSESDNSSSSNATSTTLGYTPNSSMRSSKASCSSCQVVPSSIEKCICFFYIVSAYKNSFLCMITDKIIHLHAGFAIVLHDNDHLNQMDG
jgi:hypothetical protein